MIALGAAHWLFAGCTQVYSTPDRPDLRPLVGTANGATLPLDRSQVEPMFTELLPIDLETVVRVAMAQNIDIQLAKYEVQHSQGRLESAVGGVFPVVAPLALFEHVEGSVRATEGNIVSVGFNTFQPSIAPQWIMNPGQAVYEIIAAKKRLIASEYAERATRLQTLRRALDGFYELALAQARIMAAHQSEKEARLAEREQDLAIALNALHRASLALALTLQLEDPKTTLVPKLEQLSLTPLVREDIDIDELLAHAVAFRPDLQSIRELIGVADADRGATWWRGFGPQFSVAYQYGGITGHSNNTDKGQGIPSNFILNPRSENGTFSGNVLANALIKEGILRTSRRLDKNSDQTFAFSDQQRFTATTGARWSVSAFGDLKAAGAGKEQAVLAAERALLVVKTEVIDALQASRLNRKLIDLADRQTKAAEEALRLTEANLQAGAMTTLDVLQAQDAVAQARLRYAESMVRFNQSEVNLMAAVGLLTE
jgi:outer membrane protein TolC